MSRDSFSSDLSVVKGGTDIPLLESTIGEFFDFSCEKHAEIDAVIVRHQNVRLSYAEFKHKVDVVACAFMRLGLKAGDRLGIWSPNNLEWVITQFATAKVGIILVNINPSYQRAELEYALTKVGCRALVLASGFKKSDYLQMILDLAPELVFSTPCHLASKNLPQLKIVIRLGAGHSPGMMNFSDLCKPASKFELTQLKENSKTLHTHDPINIQFTSGTTGNPKGATLTHHNILNNGYFVGKTIKLYSGARLCIPVPLYHCFGMVMGNIGCLTHGSTMIYPSDSFDPLATLQAIDHEKCMALYGVPTMFIAILDHPEFDQYDLSTLKTGIMAGSPCPVEVMRQVITKMYMKEVTIAYGMTETSPVSFQSHTDDSIERRVSTIGTVHPHCEVKIIDEYGAITARGVPGELCTRGYSVMRGYWNDDEKTQAAIDEEGWMHSGDLATIDHEGYGNIVGRIKDMIIRGGENIYPREIEEFLYKHPDVLDVQVVGIPDEKYGEEVCAVIIPRPGKNPTSDSISSFCTGQISHYKIPRYVQFVNAFPTTVTGKIQKYKIREQVQKQIETKRVN